MVDADAHMVFSRPRGAMPRSATCSCRTVPITCPPWRDVRDQSWGASTSCTRSSQRLSWLVACAAQLVADQRVQPLLVQHARALMVDGVHVGMEITPHCGTLVNRLIFRARRRECCGRPGISRASG